MSSREVRQLLRDEANELLLKGIESGVLSEVEQAIQRGANVNWRDPDSGTMLHFACAAGNEEIAKLLINKKAYVNAKGHCGKTPLHVAAEAGDIGVIRLLISHGADTELRDDNQQLPVHYAVGDDLNGLAKHPENICALLEASPRSQQFCNVINVLKKTAADRGGNFTSRVAPRDSTKLSDAPTV